jgi:hypothetical protein
MSVLSTCGGAISTTRASFAGPLLTRAQMRRNVEKCAVDVSEIERFLAPDYRTTDDARRAILRLWRQHLRNQRLPGSVASPLHLGSCAVVGKSWNLDHSNVSAHIDGHDVVFRTNGWVPQRDNGAGKRTTYLLLNRVASLSWIAGKGARPPMPQPIYNLVSPDDFRKVLEPRPLAARSDAGTAMTLLQPVQILNPQLPLIAREILAGVGSTKSWPTHGLLAVLVALSWCKRVSVFGMAGLAAPDTRAEAGAVRTSRSSSSSKPTPVATPGFERGFYSARHSFGANKPFWTFGHDLAAEHLFLRSVLANASCPLPASVSRLTHATSIAYQLEDGTMVVRALSRAHRAPIDPIL